MDHEQVNILLVDDQPAKLLAYEVILKELGENLVAAASGRDALEYLLKNEVAVILLDVCMPELDGFELAAMIREHPRFQKTAMIFISAIQVSDIDRLRGYEMGAVDYVPVPVVPEVLRAKIRVFAELYRKTRQLERLNAELEDRVRARTAELENSTVQLVESERRRNIGFLASILSASKSPRRMFRRCCIPTTSMRCAKSSRISKRARRPTRRSFGSSAPMARFAGAPARPRPPSKRMAAPSA